MHTSGSLGQYSWNQRGPSPFSFATSSRTNDDTVDSAMPMPSSCRHPCGRRSASGCTIDCTPIGEVITGALSSLPSTVVVRSRWVEPVSMRGTMRHRSNASRFARAVAPEPAEPATYQNGL